MWINILHICHLSFHLVLATKYPFFSRLVVSVLLKYFTRFLRIYTMMVNDNIKTAVNIVFFVFCSFPIFTTTSSCLFESEPHSADWASQTLRKNSVKDKSQVNQKQRQHCKYQENCNSKASHELYCIFNLYIHSILTGSLFLKPIRW